MKKPEILLPVSFKFAGIVFFFLGIFLGTVRFRFGIKPEMLNARPFAFFSSYLENKYMQFIGNNLSEEFVGLSLLLGLFLIAFARDRVETEQKRAWRTKALYLTMYVQMSYLIFALLFTFGFAFVYALMGFMLLPFFAFIILFRGMQLFHALRIRKNNLANNHPKNVAI
jgi:divalent metal cation (Fe/Co/Zn/Cd) transporter